MDSLAQLYSLGISGQWLALAFLIPPVLYLFLTKITGIPFLEARKLEASGDAYKSYVANTSPFFPWPPRSKDPNS